MSAIRFPGTPATILTERIMSEIAVHLAPDSYEARYDKVYGIVHRLVLADTLVANLAKKLRGE